MKETNKYIQEYRNEWIKKEGKKKYNLQEKNEK